MTDRRESYVALVLASLRDSAKIGNSAAKAARFFLAYVVAEATTYKDSRVLSQSQELPLLRLIIRQLVLRRPESYSLHECEPAR